jgi:hypothetical protein
MDPMNSLDGRWRLILGVLGTVGLGACSGDTTTGVRIHVSFAGQSANQIEFTIFSADHATTLVAPTLRPAAAAHALSSPQSVVVLLPAVAQTVICRARLLSTPVVEGEQSAAVQIRHVSEVEIALLPVTDVEGADGGGGDRVADAPDAPDAADAAPAPPETADAGGAGTDDAGAGDAAPSGQINGAPCGDGTTCASGFCANGLCCDQACTGTCTACDLGGRAGTCSPIAAGTPAPAGQCAAQAAALCGADGTCDGNGACRKRPAGAQCKAASCSGSMVVSSSTCDGDGVCVAGAAIACDPFQCDPSTISCYATCASNGQCLAGKTCDLTTGSCGLKPLGAQCTDSAQCNGGATCADGVCCSTACDRSCFLCSQPGHEGLCTAIPAGALDPKGICADAGQAGCGTNGLCDGAGGCQKYAVGTVCFAQACGVNAGQQVPPRTCDQDGNCTGAAAAACAGHFACNVASGSCNVGPCTDDSQCAKSCNENNGKCK